jgi:transcriptional regulator with XRE-family HTH domain
MMLGMYDIPSLCRTRETQLEQAGLHIQDVLKRAGVDRSTWTGWKHRSISPRMDTLQRVEEEIAKVLGGAQ